MTQDELERRLRDWYRAEVAEREAAPDALYASVRAIPERMPAPVGAIGTRRGFILLAAATLLLTLLIGTTIAIGSGLLPPPWAVDDDGPVPVDQRPAPSSSAAPAQTFGPAPAYVCPDVDASGEGIGVVSGSGWPSPDERAADPGPGAIVGWDGPGADLVLVDPRTGTETPALDGVPTVRPHGLAASPDGQAVAVGWCDLIVMVDGELHWPASGLQSTQAFQWSPDSSRIAMVAFQGTQESLMVVRQDGTPAVDLGNPCEGCQIQGAPLWSPDGSLLAVSYQRGVGLGEWGFGFVDPDGGPWRTQPMTPMTPMTLGMVTGWLDDDHLVALVWESDTISGPPAWVSISADASDDVQALDLEGDPAADMWARHEAATTRGLLFSADRSLIAFVSRDDGGGPLAPYEVSIADPATGDDRVVWSGAPSEGAWPVWSPDGSAVAITTFTHSADTQGVWIVNADGSEMRRIRNIPFDLISWQSHPAATER